MSPRSRACARAELVEPQREVAQLLVTRRRRRASTASASVSGRSWPASALVVGREERLGQPLGLLQPGRQRAAPDRARLLVLAPRRARTGSRARRTRAGPAGSRARASPGPRRRAGGLGEVGGVGTRSRGSGTMSAVCSNQNVDERGEHPALVGDQVGQHDVEHRDPVGRDHQHAVVPDLVELAHLAGVEVRQRRCRLTPAASPMSSSASNDAVDVRERALRGRSTRRARASSSVAGDLGVVARARRGTAARSCHARIALRCTMRYASSRVAPASTSASSTGWLNTSPNDASRFSQHALGIHAHALDDRRELHEHVVGEHAASRGG